MQDFRNLVVWQKSHKLVRAATSVPQTSQKGAVGLVIGTSGGSSDTPWDPPANLSIICFLPGTSASWRTRLTSRSILRLARSSGCLPGSFDG